MKYSEAQKGRVFVIRLEDGDIVHEALEQFARDNGVQAASLIAVGGADAGSRLIVGPEAGRADPVVPVPTELSDVHEAVGTGTIFPSESGEPVLHLHMACGRGAETITGCVRAGVRVWHVMEVVLQEIVDTTAVRRPDATTGFDLLEP